MLWMCPRCRQINGWTSRTRRPKKRIDTNCGGCMYRVRFTPKRADENNREWWSDGRGRKATVRVYHILDRWVPQRVIYRMASSKNQERIEKVTEINQSRDRDDPLYVPLEFSTFNLEHKEWRKSE